MKPIFETHVSKTPGLTMEPPTVSEIYNSLGQHYWKATAPIGTIFGHEVEGDLTAIGRTRAEALERLATEVRKLHESLWDSPEPNRRQPPLPLPLPLPD